MARARRTKPVECTELDIAPDIDASSRRRADARKLHVLRVERGPEVMRFVVIRDGHEVLIGRDPDTCDLVLDDGSVSREHVLVRHLKPDRLMIEDRGSTNGTSINGSTLEGAQPIEPGDQLEVGSVPIRIERLSLEEIATLGELVALLEDAREGSVTGLLHRRFVDNVLPRQLVTFAQARIPCTLMVVGIDGLKPLISGFGPKLGDAVLRVIGRLVRDSVRLQDRAVRLSVDEVALILPNCEEGEGIRIAERLAERIAEHDWAATLWPTGRPKGAPEGVSVICGVGDYRTDETVPQWVSRCRRALIVARTLGEGRVVAASQVA